MLNERGAKATGGNEFPTQDQLAQTDVLIIHCDGGGNFKPEERTLLDDYTKRGGGIVVIHAGSVSDTPEGTEYFKQLIGGSWKRPVTKWLEGPMNLYFTDRQNPITRDCSNFEMDDEIYYDMDILPEVRVLAGAYTPNPIARNEKSAKRAQELTAGGRKVSVYDVQPQIWTYEKDKYRSFVCIPGHYHANFSRTNFRTVLLRGIAWAGKRANADELCKPNELGDSLRYVEGGPTHPSKAAEKLEVHPEFNISLIASEPLVNKVMNVDWDEKGRLWVCETPEYPNGRRKPNTEIWKESGSVIKENIEERDPIDRLSWLEDTDGDGIMDKKHVFADKLELVTSFVFYKNGVIATSAPDIWFLEDTTGKGVCDKRTKLYTGLGKGDTHAVINNARWGLDGWIYATNGYSTSSKVTGFPQSEKSEIDFGGYSAGVVRFKPDGSAFEQYSSKGSNTWGLTMTWDGQCFFTQPTCGDVLMHVVLPEFVLAKGKLPGTNSYNVLMKGESTFPLMKWEEQAYVQIDQVGKFTAAAGCAIYEGGAWPAKWNYSYFTTEPTINIVSQRFVTPDGVTYKAAKEKGREETEFIRSKDLWFRPIENRVGPDGALYIVDFYNQAVIHNDTRGPQHGPAGAAVRPDRDHYFSRIWKVQHKEAKKIEVPVLDKRDLAGMVKAIETSPNAHVRQNAFRLITENFDGEVLKKDAAIFLDGEENSVLRSCILQNALQAIGYKGEITFEATSPSGGKSIRFVNRTQTISPEFVEHLISNIAEAKFLAGANMPLALYSLGEQCGRAEIREAILRGWPKLTDQWSRSAVIAAASNHAIEFLSDAVDLNNGKGDISIFASAILPAALQSADVAKISKLLNACAAAPSSADGLKTVILQGFAQQTNITLSGDSTVADALRKLLKAGSTRAAALPLVAKWDTKGVLADDVNGIISSLVTELQSGKDEAARIANARSLIAVRRLSPKIMETMSTVLADDATPPTLRREIIQALGDSEGDDAAGALVSSYGKLKLELQQVAFDQLLKRASWAILLLNAVKDEKIKAADLGPANVARLRTHPDPQIAKLANAMMDKLISPASKEKNKLLATLTPEVEKPGNAEKGKLVFTATCAICHSLGAPKVLSAASSASPTGQSALPALKAGPPLDGMGAHSPADLLVAVLDPNREVDPSFHAWNITKKNGEVLAGVIAQENTASLQLRNQTGTFEIRKDEIAKRENTQRSLMPEGLEALDAENLRDLMTFLNASETRFRIVNLAQAYTADTRRGLFASVEAVKDSVHFTKFGNISAEGVPYFIQDPAKSQSGSNVIVLKGGGGKNAAQQYPQRVEIAVNTAAKRLHLLSGIAGWGYPATKDDSPAMKVTIIHTDGQNEVTELRNGDAFADYNKVVDVPGSVLVEGLVSQGQLRRITLPVKNTTPITKLVLESYDNKISPLVCAITADIAGAGPQPTGSVDSPVRIKNNGGGAAKKKDADKTVGAPSAPTAEIKWEEGKTKVLIVAGGSSHDFKKWFEDYDSTFLKAAGFSVNSTEDSAQATAELANADVAIISTNRNFFDTIAWRTALFDFIAKGKGVIMLHPGTWYGFGKWPELNAQVVGGGARGHDAIDKFTVSVLKKDHPVMAGVPASFIAEDELYYINAEADKIPAGTLPIEVLAETSPSKKYKTGHPSVWVTKNDKAKIVGIALGHDGRVHELDAYKAILINAVKWTKK
jgi:putative membrane-bound dehydrogenase-like protein